MIYRLLAWVLARPRVFSWLLARAQRTPYNDITNLEGSEVYMRRWWLLNPYHDTPGLRRFDWCPVSIRVHHILRRDHDRHLHDHPWNARTFVLKGWYLEQTEDGCNMRIRGHSAAIRYEQYHRILSVSEEGVYTMFVTGRYRGTWGFKVAGRKMPYKQYLGLE